MVTCYINAVIYFIFKLLNLGIYKIFSKRIKDYQLALIVSILLILINLFTSSHFQMTEAYLTKNVNFCERLNSADKIHCVSMIAKLRNDKAICNMLPEQVGRNFCSNKFNEFENK